MKDKRMSRSRLDIVVVGGGVVGAACALALAKLGLEVALVEGRDEIESYTGHAPRGGDPVTLEETIAEAELRLRGLVRAYADPKRGYLSRARPFRKTDRGDYDHLARVSEWSIEDDGGEE